MRVPSVRLLVVAICCLLTAGVDANRLHEAYEALFGTTAALCTEKQSPFGSPCNCPREESRMYQGTDCSNREIGKLPVNLVLPRGIPSVSFQQNQLSVVKQDQFQHNAAVQSLRLSKNQIVTIEPRAFSSLPGLELLQLDKNEITEIDVTAFESLSRLERLDLAFNKLRRLEPALFTGTAIRELRLQFNPLVTLDPNQMLFMPKLQKLDLGSTDLSELPPEIFSSSPHLITLLLPHNQLTAVPRAALAGAANLNHLDLSGNELQTVPSAAFTECPQLRRLVLSSMKTLQRVEANAFSGLDQLEELLCQFNPALTEVDETAFLHAGSAEFLASLQMVDLKENALTKLSPNLLPWGEVKLVDLEMNPWNCDCDMEWVASVNHSFVHEPLFKCSQPEAVSGQAVSTLTSEEFICEDEGANIALIVCLTLLGVGIVAALVFAVWKFKACQKTQEKLFTRHKYGAVPVRAHPNKIDLEGMTWDGSDIGV